MAGSSTPNMDNFSPQAMEHRQMIMNTEVMKQITIMNRASVREIMLQHEKTFKEQVHDLHKLYEVQRSLMHKVKCRQPNSYSRVSQSSSDHACVFPHEPNNLQAQGKVWEDISTAGAGTFKGSTNHEHQDFATATDEREKLPEEKPKNTGSSTRKRIIDLEQLPEDDTDDDMEKTENGPGLVTSDPQGNLKDLVATYTGHEHNSQTYLTSNFSTTRHPKQPPNNTTEGTYVGNEGTDVGNDTNGGRSPSASLFMNYMEGPKFNIPIVEQTPNMSIQNSYVSSNSFGKGNTVFSPQIDQTVDRPSQEVANWLFQASSLNTDSRSTAEHIIRQPHEPTPRMVMQETLFKGYHQQSPSNPHASQGLVSKHPGGKILPLEDRSHMVNWTRVLEENKSKGFVSSSGTPEKPSTLFTTEVYSQGGQPTTVVCTTGLEVRDIERRHAPSSLVSHSINAWYAHNPVVQLSQYQREAVLGSQVFQPNLNQPAWLQSSQNAHGNLHTQQMIYGAQAPDSSQVGFRLDNLQIAQGDSNGSWNTSGAGQYHNSFSVSQKPPFKKPPKLVLKNDESGIELRVVSQEIESTEKTMQKQPDSLKRELQQGHLKTRESKSDVKGETKEGCITHEDGIDGTDSSLHNCAEQGAVSTSVAQDSNTEDSVRAQSLGRLTASKQAHNSLAVSLPVSSVAQCDTAAAVYTEGYMGDDHNIYASSSSVNRSEVQYNVHLTDKSVPQDKTDQASKFDRKVLQMEDDKGTYEKEKPAQAVVSINEYKNGLSLSGEGSSLIPAKDDMEGSVTGCINKCRNQNNNEHVQVSRKSEDVKSPVDTASTRNGSANADAIGQSSPAQTCSPISRLKDDNGYLEEIKDVCDSNLYREAVAPKSDHGIPFTTNRSSRKHDTHCKSPLPENVLAQVSDLGTLTMQAVSMQSTSTEPGIVKQERECSSKDFGSSVVDKDTVKKCSSGIRKRKSVSVTSERTSLSFPSIKVSLKQIKPEMPVCDVEDHISDTENLAAAILLSFAPKPIVDSRSKHLKDAGKTSSSVRKGRPAEHASSCTRQRGASPAECVRDTESEDVESADCREPESKIRSGSRRMDGLDSVRIPKDRFREERVSSRFQADTGKGNTKNTRSKVLRVVTMGNTVDNELVDCSRSKHLDKIGAGFVNTKTVDTRDHPIAYKGKDVFHTPTGRRSSRGPPIAGRVHLDSISRSQQLMLHYSDGSGSVNVNSRKRNESCGDSSKLEASLKSKPWSDIIKKRSRVRGQINDIPYKKTQSLQSHTETADDECR